MCVWSSLPAAEAEAQLRWNTAAACQHSCGTWPNTVRSKLCLRWSGWSVWWTTWWSWMAASAAVALSTPAWQRHTQADDREGHTTIHIGELSSALLAPSPLLSPSASDNRAKCNLQHYLHLFTFTNYIPLKLPRKICQKNVITQSWNLASSEISSHLSCTKAWWDLTVASSGSWGPRGAPEMLPEPCLGLGICRWALQRQSGCLELRLHGLWALEDCPCQAASGGGAVRCSVAMAGWNVATDSACTLGLGAWPFSLIASRSWRWGVLSGIYASNWRVGTGRISPVQGH